MADPAWLFLFPACSSRVELIANLVPCALTVLHKIGSLLLLGMYGYGA